MGEARYSALLEGGKFFFGSEGNVKSDIQICDGVMDASGKPFGFEYEKRAVIPRKPWRSLSDAESSILYSNDTALDYRDNFSVIHLPDDLVDLISFLEISNVNSEDEVHEIKKSKPKEFVEFKRSIEKYISGYLDSGDINQRFGVIVNSSNRQTVTVRNHKYATGLHIDSWDQFRLKELGLCSNRICINMGREDRYLLLMNQRLDTFYSWIQDEVNVDLDKDFWKDQVVLEIFEKIRDYPVLKIRIKPMQAYIAPTELLIHDGCTEGNTTPDIDMTFRGHFNLHKNRINELA